MKECGEETNEKFGVLGMSPILVAWFFSRLRSQELSLSRGGLNLMRPSEIRSIKLRIIALIPV